VPGNNELSVVLSLSLQLDRLRTPQRVLRQAAVIGYVGRRPVYPHIAADLSRRASSAALGHINRPSGRCILLNVC
jgi:hypothetical protein